MKRCSRCGADADWLVTQPYNPPTRAGRVLAYCDGCREVYRDRLGVVLPWQLFMDHPDAVLTSLYESGCVGTDPQTLVDVLGLPVSRWVERAEATLARGATTGGGPDAG